MLCLNLSYELVDVSLSVRSGIKTERSLIPERAAIIDRSRLSTRARDGNVCLFRPLWVFSCQGLGLLPSGCENI